MLKSNIMEFELTPELTDEIIFAMEDQTGHFLFDSAESRCVDSRDSVSADDDERYYAIPLWDSVSGFRMMDRFVSQLRNPIAREELRVALSSGHGVFRKFKDILKEHVEIERLWFLFKEREMRNLVLEWYNGLRDFWGLDRIGAEPEETDDIVSQDFLFRPFTFDDGNSLEVLMAAIEQEIAADMPLELSGAISELWSRIRGDGAESESEHIMLAETGEREIVGAAISAPIPDGSFLSVQVTMVAVFPEYRGLGIGKELLARTISWWADKGYRWLLFTAPVIPRAFMPVLHRSGFTDKGHVSVLDLSETHWH